MPLVEGKSKEALSENVRREMHVGKPQKQAVAITYSQKERSDMAGPDLSGYTQDQLRHHVAEGKGVGRATHEHLKTELRKREARGPDPYKTMRNYKGEEVPNPNHGKMWDWKERSDSVGGVHAAADAVENNTANTTRSNMADGTHQEKFDRVQEVFADTAHAVKGMMRRADSLMSRGTRSDAGEGGHSAESLSQMRDLLNRSAMGHTGDTKEHKAAFTAYHNRDAPGNRRTTPEAMTKAHVDLHSKMMEHHVTRHGGRMDAGEGGHSDESLSQMRDLLNRSAAGRTGNTKEHKTAFNAYHNRDAPGRMRTTPEAMTKAHMELHSKMMEHEVGRYGGRMDADDPYEYHSYSASGRVKVHPTLEQAKAHVSRHGLAEGWKKAGDGSHHADAWNRGKSTSNAVAVEAHPKGTAKAQNEPKHPRL